MDLAALSLSIYNRAASDSGTNKLLGTGGYATGFYNTNAPDDAVFPYCVYTVAAAVPDDTFTSEVSEVIFRIAVYEQREPDGSSPRDPILRCSNIMARLHGDSSAGSAPTYGFHRYAISISSGTSWASGQIMRGSMNESHSEDFYQYNLDFRLLLTR